EIAESPQSLAYGRAFLLDTEQIEAFRTNERVGNEGSDLLGRERAQAAKLIFRLARRTNDEIDPSDDRSTDDLGDCSVGPACGDQFLQDAHVARGDVVVEIFACAIPSFRKLEGSVAKHSALPLEQLSVQILEERQHHPLLGAKVIVDLAQRHASGGGHV